MDVKQEVIIPRAETNPSPDKRDNDFAHLYSTFIQRWHLFWSFCKPIHLTTLTHTVMCRWFRNSTVLKEGVVLCMVVKVLQSVTKKKENLLPFAFAGFFFLKTVNASRRALHKNNFLRKADWKIFFFLFRWNKKDKTQRKRIFQMIYCIWI